MVKCYERALDMALGKLVRARTVASWRMAGGEDENAERREHRQTLRKTEWKT
jgi:hypothetical protein